eukprot:TRINITY_DN10487_c0_g1_i2.p2 TRINITY_DN10487_c0_g1~~TRINITY_DN10487_c0_g1_i2.p2  ORF type:complete len:136 (+),score=25.32 TRINITY_DN10487_c0_g1_i2:565-972(+)
MVRTSLRSLVDAFGKLQTQFVWLCDTAAAPRRRLETSESGRSEQKRWEAALAVIRRRMRIEELWMSARQALPEKTNSETREHELEEKFWVVDTRDLEKDVRWEKAKEDLFKVLSDAIPHAGAKDKARWMEILDPG